MTASEVITQSLGVVPSFVYWNHKKKHLAAGFVLFFCFVFFSGFSHNQGCLIFPECLVCQRQMTIISSVLQISDKSVKHERTTVKISIQTITISYSLTFSTQYLKTDNIS